MAKKVNRNKKKKSNNKIKWVAAMAVLLMMAGGGYWWYLKNKEKQAAFVRYPAFGIELPGNYNIHGIDISKYQGYIDWPSVKEMQVRDVKIGFAFMKATEGLNNVDRHFKRNWKNAQKAGITKGAYHFFVPTRSGKEQARNFIKAVDLQPGDLPPVLDIEQLYGVRPSVMRQQVQDWLNIIEDYYKVKPIIYTYVNFYATHLAGQFDDYPLWAAHYIGNDKPRINRRWIFWQHSEKGRVNGITQPVDFNVFNGDSTDFKALLVK